MFKSEVVEPFPVHLRTRVLHNVRRITTVRLYVRLLSGVVRESSFRQFLVQLPWLDREIEVVPSIGGCLVV
jgi:hypothetical protein